MSVKLYFYTKEILFLNKSNVEDKGDKSGSGKEEKVECKNKEMDQSEVEKYEWKVKGRRLRGKRKYLHWV